MPFNIKFFQHALKLYFPCNNFLLLLHCLCESNECANKQHCTAYYAASLETPVRAIELRGVAFCDVIGRRVQVCQQSILSTLQYKVLLTYFNDQSSRNLFYNAKTHNCKSWIQRTWC